MEHYSGSIQYSIDRAKASLQELATDFLSSDFLKGLVDTGNTVINVIDTITSKAGSLTTVATAIGAALGFTNHGVDKMPSIIKYKTYDKKLLCVA